MSKSNGLKNKSNPEPPKGWGELGGLKNKNLLYIYKMLPGHSNHSPSPSGGIDWQQILRGAGGGAATGAGLGPWGAIIGAGAGTLGNIFGQIWSNNQNKRMAEDQRKWLEAIMKFQNQFSLDMWDQQKDWSKEFWDLQNEYNSPKEQMKRIAEAGLNPHLMYGQGTVGNAQQPAQPSQPKAAGPGNYQRHNFQNPMMGANPFGQYYTFRNLGAQTNNVAEMTKQAAQQTANLAVDGLNKALDLDIKGKAKYDIVRNYKYQADVTRENANNAVKQGRIFDANEKNTIKQLELIKQNLENAKTDGEIKGEILKIKQAEKDYKETTGTTDPNIFERLLFESGLYEWLMNRVYNYKPW